MILGNDRPGVVEHIRQNTEAGLLNAKAELDDPDLSMDQRQQRVQEFLDEHAQSACRAKRQEALGMVAATGWKVNHSTRVEGLEKVRDLKGPAVVVCNHFNQLDNTVVRHALHQISHQPVYTVIEDTNLSLPGVVGFVMNYADTIPLIDNYDYLRGPFLEQLEAARAQPGYILIYPEQEMWFNYRKPRPGKRGAYYYASKLQIPVISLFVEIQDKEDMDDDHFHQVQYVVHILDPLYPDPSLSDRKNAIHMLEQDNAQRKAAYEAAYGKPLTYAFDYSDIAGYVPPRQDKDPVTNPSHGH